MDPMISERCLRDQESSRVSELFSIYLSMTELLQYTDKIPGPYKNEEEARAANNGAYPPDLSLYSLPSVNSVIAADFMIGL